MAWFKCNGGGSGSNSLFPDGKFLMLYAIQGSNDLGYFDETKGTLAFFLTPNVSETLQSINGSSRVYALSSTNYSMTSGDNGNKYIIDKTKIPYTKVSFTANSADVNLIILAEGVADGVIKKYFQKNFRDHATNLTITIDLNSISEDIVFIHLYNRSSNKWTGQISFSN